MALSKTQIDKLGDRLKSGDVADEDLEALEEYRRSFAGAHDRVFTTISERLGLQPGARRAKVTASIIDKLRRESIRLTQIQDIAGCRLVVPDRTAQDHVVESLQRLFPDSVMFDRRATPSHGYRAVHVVVNVDDKAIEVQVRTQLQHEWAELSEKLSDAVDPQIKYGGGRAHTQELMKSLSEVVATVETDEAGLSRWEDRPTREWFETMTQKRHEMIRSLLKRLAADVRGV